jgi:hypothetical protein
MTAKLITFKRGRDAGRVVPTKPREPGEEGAAQHGGQYPQGVFDLVFRVVRGRVEVIKATLPAKPLKKQAYRELHRYRLKPEQASLTVTQLNNLLHKEIAALQAKENAKTNR